MKVLILSISTGQGHHATGSAIEQYLQQRGVRCETLDAYGYIKPLYKALVSKGYTISTSYMPKLFGKLYDIEVKKTKPVRDYSLAKLANTKLSEELMPYINNYKPDAIICTHVLSSTMVNILNEREKLNAITVGIVTDFTLHPLWEEARKMDYYVTPSELLEYQLMQKGLDPDRMLPFGIPIRSNFSSKINKVEARKQLKIDLDKPTILLMSGSMGYGKIDASLEKLDELNLDFQLMVVCGNNKKMFKKVSKMHMWHKTHVYGYVNNVDVMMDAADFIITKPGGITSSEALAKELPMIMVNPIPGHEERNAEFMLNNGLALYATKSFPLEESVHSLLKHPERLNHLRSAIAFFGRKNAAEDLCEYLIDEVHKRRMMSVMESGF